MSVPMNMNTDIVFMYGGRKVSFRYILLGSQLHQNKAGNIFQQKHNKRLGAQKKTII